MRRRVTVGAIVVATIALAVTPSTAERPTAGRVAGFNTGTVEFKFEKGGKRTQSVEVDGPRGWKYAQPVLAGHDCLVGNRRDTVDRPMGHVVASVSYDGQNGTKAVIKATLGCLDGNEDDGFAGSISYVVLFFAD